MDKKIQQAMLPGSVAWFMPKKQKMLIDKRILVVDSLMAELGCMHNPTFQ